MYIQCGLINSTPIPPLAPLIACLPHPPLTFMSSFYNPLSQISAGCVIMGAESSTEAWNSLKKADSPKPSSPVS